MTLLNRYIAKNIFSAIALVTLMLAGLQIFMLFVNQLDDLGKADYGILQAFLYVFLQMPYQVYLFFPMACLLGCLIGLGIMANHRELVIMRAAGVSIGQITKAVLKLAFILILLVTLVGELFVPRLARFANEHRSQAVNGGQTLKTAHGVWLRRKNDFIFIMTILPNHKLLYVHQYHFDEAHQLRFARIIGQIDLIHNRWVAFSVQETLFQSDKTVSQYIPMMFWDVDVKPKILSFSSNEPDEMTLHELKQFLRDQKRSHHLATNYRLAYWQRILQPLTTIVMMLLAIPFIFGPLRSSTMGSKLLAGATVGFGFHIVNQFFGPASQVLQWPAEAAAMGPTCLFALLGIYLMRRVR